MSRGHDRERQVRNWLRDQDWVVVRAAGSFGAGDLVAGRHDQPTRLVEVKSTAGGPYERFGPDQRNMLIDIAGQAGWHAWLAWWPPRGQLVWIPSDHWPAGQGRGTIRADAR